MAQIVDGYRQVITKGQYMGEEGTGYYWGTLPSYGDMSRDTLGRYQGYTQPCRIEILVDGGELAKAMDDETYLYVPASARDKFGYTHDRHALTADEAIHLGFARPLDD